MPREAIVQKHIVFLPSVAKATIVLWKLNRRNTLREQAVSEMIRMWKIRMGIIRKNDKRTISNNSRRFKHKGQAKKSTRRMPWHWEPTKDVISCEKLRLGANIHRPADIRMGQPAWMQVHVSITEFIGYGREPPELKHLSRARKSNQPRFRK